jgi:hypothetical protein
LKYLLQKKRFIDLDRKATEKQDFNQKGAFVPEFKDFTPAMLATASGKVECLKMLLTNGADPSVVDPSGNNLAMIAV